MVMKYISFCGSTQDGTSCGKVLRRGISMLRGYGKDAAEGKNGRNIALRCPRPRAAGGTSPAGHADHAARCAAERGADGAARRPYHSMECRFANALVKTRRFAFLMLWLPNLTSWLLKKLRRFSTAGTRTNRSELSAG